MLYQDRDLRPTADLRNLLKGLLADHLGLPATLLGEHVFPHSHDVAPRRGLIA